MMIDSTNVERSSRLSVDWAPAWELLVSLKAYANHGEHRVLDLGPGWARLVREQLSAGVAAEIASPSFWHDAELLDLLVWQCPGQRSAPDFPGWLGRLSPGDALELVVPFAVRPLPKDIRGVISRYADTLHSWNEQYFSRIDPLILSGLADEANTLRALQGTESPEELVERVTGGLRFTSPPAGTADRIIVLPQHHYSPLNHHLRFRELRLVQYPADVVPCPGGMPDRRLLRSTQALSDPTRLRILRLIGRGPYRFAAIASELGIPKTTLHHHLVLLRAAGLVRVFHPFERQVAYALRAHAFEDIGRQLQSYVQEG